MLALFKHLRAMGHTGIFIYWLSGMLESIGTKLWREIPTAVNDNEAKP